LCVLNLLLKTLYDKLANIPLVQHANICVCVSICARIPIYHPAANRYRYNLDINLDIEPQLTLFPTIIDLFNVKSNTIVMFTFEFINFQKVWYASNVLDYPFSWYKSLPFSESINSLNHSLAVNKGAVNHGLMKCGVISNDDWHQSDHSN
jgi:hypothetical protein